MEQFSDFVYFEDKPTLPYLARISSSRSDERTDGAGLACGGEVAPDGGTDGRRGGLGPAPEPNIAVRIATQERARKPPSLLRT